jgi:hypothetical protein
MSQNDILFVHVEPGDEKLDPGDWFFDTGGWWLCGQTGQEENGRWYLVGVPTRANRSPHDESIKFASFTPPHRYLTNRRIERAKSLLAARKLSVTEIGLNMGFKRNELIYVRVST